MFIILRSLNLEQTKVLIYFNIHMLSSLHALTDWDAKQFTKTHYESQCNKSCLINVSHPLKAMLFIYVGFRDIFLTMYAFISVSLPMLQVPLATSCSEEWHITFSIFTQVLHAIFTIRTKDSFQKHRLLIFAANKSWSNQRQ